MRNFMYRIINLTRFMAAFVASIGAASRMWISAN